MSNRNRNKKGKDVAKAVFVESSAPMTKSRNMAEENMLRHKLKGLEDQRRRSILALKEEEKLLIKDLETQKRRGSLTHSAADTDKSGTAKDQLQIKHTNASRRSSCTSTDGSDNSIKIKTTNSMMETNNNNNNHNNNRRMSTSNSVKNSDRNDDIESRKHLWKYPNSSMTPSSRRDSTPSNGSISMKSSERVRGDNDKVHISDIVSEYSSQRDRSNGCSNLLSSTNRLNDAYNNNNSSMPQPRGSIKTSSRASLPRTTSIDLHCIEEPFGVEEQPRLRSDRTMAGRENRPTKPRTKSEERRDRTLTAVQKQSSSQNKWSTSFEALDNELNSAYGMIDKHAKKLSRSVNINIGEEDPNDKTSMSYNTLATSKSTSDYNCLNNRLSKSIKQLSNSLQNCSLSPQNSNTFAPNGQSAFHNNTRSKDPDIFYSKLEQDPIDKLSIEADQRLRKRRHTNQTEISNSLIDTSSAMSSQIDSKHSNNPDRRNSVGRNKILLSPINRASRPQDQQQQQQQQPQQQTSGYTPTCVENKQTTAAKKASMKKRRSINDQIPESLLKHVTVGNHVTSDSDSGGSNVPRKGSIRDNTTGRKASAQSPLDLPVRPVSSWSQRKRSIVFGEKSPQTPREVLNDTHAQWEELGDFLGEIRKQHNIGHARLSSGKQSCNTGNASHRQENQQQPRRDSDAFASLVEQRLLPRRHSESNIILLSRASATSSSSKGKRDVLDLRQEASSRHAARRKSCIPPDHACSMAANHHAASSTSVKKLVTIHNALQSSALSMADMESEMF